MLIFVLSFVPWTRFEFEACLLELPITGEIYFSPSLVHIQTLNFLFRLLQLITSNLTISRKPWASFCSEISVNFFLLPPLRQFYLIIIQYLMILPYIVFFEHESNSVLNFPNNIDFVASEFTSKLTSALSQANKNPSSPKYLRSLPPEIISLMRQRNRLHMIFQGPDLPGYEWD